MYSTNSTGVIISDSDKNSWTAHLRKLYQLFVVEKRPQNAKDTGACVYPPLNHIPNAVGCAVGCLISLKLANQLEDANLGGLNCYISKDLQDHYLYQSLCKELNLSLRDETNHAVLAMLQDAHDDENEITGKDLDERMAEAIEKTCQYLGIPYESVTINDPIS